MDFINTILSSIFNILSDLLSLISFKRQTLVPGHLQLNIKFSSASVQLDVDPKWTIKTVKEKLSSKIGVPVDQMKLIFAGKELHNSVTLEEYDMSHQSIIHAVRTQKPTVSIETRDSIPDLMKLDFNTCHNEKSDLEKHDTRKISFYVYCSKPCNDIQPGKLRVRCNECKRGTLTVSKDPCGWEDVLKPERIPGVCQIESCTGKFAEFYFKCATHPADEDDTCVALSLVRSNVNNIVCLICTDVNDPVLVFTCAKSHVICIDCFRRYGLSRLNERQFVQDATLGYTLPCPIGCENSLIADTHHFHLLGDEQYSRYQKFGAEECLLQAGGVLCPIPGCGSGILPDPECRKIVCGGQGCGFVFCRNCLQGYHLGDCDDGLALAATGYTVAFTVDATMADNSRWSLDNPAVVKILTKPCPKCRTPTERDGGCMHMICTRPQCGFHWCWICQMEWTRDCMGNHWFG